MNPKHPVTYDEFVVLVDGPEVARQASDEDLWFLSGPAQEEPDFLPPGPRAEPDETSVVSDWVKAEAACAARLARVAGRLGALDDRLRRGPEGWRQRLALLEAADLSWFLSDRVAPDRLALRMSLRLSGVEDDSGALARVGWAVRRLTGGPGPEPDLPAFFDRRDPGAIAEGAEPFTDRAGAWLDVMQAASDLHPITRACMGFHLWSLAGLGQTGDQMEAAVTAGRIAASEGKGAVFAPLAMGGAGGLRAGRAPAERLVCWLGGMETACLTAMRHLEDIEAWSARAIAATVALSGKTPPALCRALTEWPLVLGPHGRAADRCQPGRRVAQPGLDEDAGVDPRSDRTGSVPHMESSVTSRRTLAVGLGD